jgi:glycosyltransferase involved in cell wall biosynthesis
MEVVIADGMSTDGTRKEIEAWSAQNTDITVRVVDNPKRVIPAALNAALAAATGEFIVRLDAHCMPAPNYVALSVQALRDGRGDDVGGIWRIKPGAAGWVAASIAVAAAHPLGVGGAQYRVGGRPQAVDTVPFGAFRRDLIERIGFYDEALLSNEDYEYNARIRKAGGVVWFDPEIQSTYFARSTFKDLARQYWRYGYWKLQMLRRYPETIRWRQGLPPLFVLNFLGLGLLSVWFGWARWLWIFETSIYSVALILAGLQLAVRHRSLQMLVGVPLAILTMHFSWGAAFVWSFVKTIFGKME